jgi:hypothetical protein
LSSIVAVAALSVVVAIPACSSSTSTVGNSFDASDRPDGTIIVDAMCPIAIDAPPFLPAMHVMIPSDVTYDSNPPSSGPHYSIWAAYQEFMTPVDPRYFVHDLEHGAIVFLYNCDTSTPTCQGMIAALRAASDSLPDDPICSPPVRVRTVITPDPQLDVPLAAVAWGWTYKAHCIDLPSLEAFARDHYSNGPEQGNCVNGATIF